MMKCSSPLWVKLPNLPLNCWGPESLSRIDSVLGVPLYADSCTTKQWRVYFARLLIGMDVTSPLPEYVWLEDDNGLMFKQVVNYDWKPPPIVMLLRSLGIIVLRRKLFLRLRRCGFLSLSSLL